MRPVALRRIGALLLGLGLLSSLAISPVLAAGITVNSLADTTADDGACTLREAIIAANTDTASGPTPGECLAGSGNDGITFSVAGSITLTSHLPTLDTNMSIAGGGVITVSGDSQYRMFSNLGATVALSGLTITAGLSPAFGGGIVNAGIMTVSDSALVDNHTVFLAVGGGIYNSAILTVTNTAISGGNAFDGGGIFNDTLASLTLVSSTISGNVATAGGGIYNAGTMTATNTTISGNTADTGAGGGIYSIGIMTVTGSTISGNTAPGGGGGGVIATAGSVTTIANATLSGNSSLLWGGGISDGGTLALTNSTISGNSSTQGGGGIQGLGVETVVNTIIAGNSTGGNPSGAEVADILETTTTSIIGVPGGKTLGDILVPAGMANNGGPTQTIALALVAGNPAIDTGTGAVCAVAPVNAIDQRGLPRPAACDIGAYEAQPPTVAAQPNASVAATSAAGAVVTYTLPAGTDEQGGAAPVACLPASGSTFPVGSTTVTCTATDAVGHTATGTFQVNVGSFVLPDAAMAQASSRIPGLLSLIGLLALLGAIGLRPKARSRRQRVALTAAVCIFTREAGSPFLPGSVTVAPDRTRGPIDASRA